MKLSCQSLEKSFGRVKALDGLSFDVPEGAFFALLGPSAAGKTTCLRTICGLERPDSGTVSVDGEDVTQAPVQGRDLAMVFQSFALYPHLSTEQNLAYPLREAGLPSAEIKSRVGEMGELLRISHALGRKTTQLSGGEQQRVAIGRALIRRPKLLLLDEPLTNLDAKLRDEMRAEFKRLHRDLGITMVYATPDQLEAMTMADTIGVLQNGQITEIGTPDALYATPGSIGVARLVGSPPINLIEATGTGAELDLGFAKIPSDHRAQGALTLGLRPFDIQVADNAETALLQGRVIVTEPLGDLEIVDVETSGNELKVALRGAQVGLAKPGDLLPLNFDANRLLYFDTKTGLRLDMSPVQN